MFSLTDGCRGMFDLWLNVQSIKFTYAKGQRLASHPENCSQIENPLGYFQSCVNLWSWSWSHLLAVGYKYCMLKVVYYQYSHFQCASSLWSPWKQSKYSTACFHLPPQLATANLSISIIWIAIHWWNSGVLTAKNIDFALLIVVMHKSEIVFEQTQEGMCRPQLIHVILYLFGLMFIMRIAEDNLRVTTYYCFTDTDCSSHGQHVHFYIK